MKIKFQHKLTTSKNILVIPIIKSDQKEKTLDFIAQTEGISFEFLKDFSAAPGETLIVTGKTSPKLFLLGLGEKLTFSNLLKIFRSFSFRQKEKLGVNLGISFDHQNLVDGSINATMLANAIGHGLLLGTYQIGLYKTAKKNQHPFTQKSSSLTFYCKSEEKKTIKQAFEKGLATAETQIQILDLVNAPGNKAKPEVLAKWAVSSAKKHGYKTTVFNKAKIKTTGLEALLAVNRGSEYPPAFIIMEYKGKAAKGKKLPKVGLVGKGVTFDTGGLSIKGHMNMHYMKSDMGGAAAVLGTMELVAKLKLPIHLIGIVPTTDNCVDATAVKPGDVIGSYSGQTIEIIDTDAEGRLILADGLAYMEKHFRPEIMIDLATLTGSTVRTLGYQAGALFTNNDDLSHQLTAAGEKTGERVWRLPLWDAYKKDIESDVADLRNFSGRPLAGAISAAKFLEAFTNNHTAWAHLDIAGVAFGDSEFSKQKSATGFGIKLLLEFLESR